MFQEIMADEKDEKQNEAATKAAENKEEVKEESKSEEVFKEKQEASPDNKQEENLEESDSEKEAEIPEQFKEFVEKIEQMSALELSELVKILESKFGVSAAPQVVAGGGGSGGGGEEEAEEKTSFNVELKDAGSQKIQIIKVVRELTGKGLKEAKDVVDGAPVVIKEGTSKEEADQIKQKLEEAGATAELQ